jgi:hypothetical protein
LNYEENQYIRYICKERAVKKMVVVSSPPTTTITMVFVELYLVNGFYAVDVPVFGIRSKIPTMSPSAAHAMTFHQPSIFEN